MMPMSAAGHSRPTHSASAPTNVRYAYDSDRSRHQCKLTLSAINERLHRSRIRFAVSVALHAIGLKYRSTIRPGVLSENHIRTYWGIEPKDDKLMRMNAQTARIEARSVYIPERAHWLDEFRKELLAFPASRHNDQIDAFSQALDHAFNNRRRGEVSCSVVRGMI
jgi:predicted phage terminase large subunit-like protein